MKACLVRRAPIKSAQCWPLPTHVTNLMIAALCHVLRAPHHGAMATAPAGTFVPRGIPIGMPTARSEYSLWQQILTVTVSAHLLVNLCVPLPCQCGGVLGSSFVVGYCCVCCSVACLAARVMCLRVSEVFVRPGWCVGPRPHLTFRPELISVSPAVVVITF